MNDVANVVNLDEYESIEIHWIGFYANGNTVTYLGLEHIPGKIKTFIDNKNIIKYIFSILTLELILGGYFTIGCIDFMFKGKNPTYFTNLFLLHDFEKNDEVK